MAYTPKAQTITRLKKAIRSFNSAVTRMGRSGLYTVIPNPTDFDMEMRRISNANDMRRRIAQLERVQKKVRPDAQNPVEYMGEIVPLYMKKEIQYSVKAVNQDRYELITRVHPGFDDYTPVEVATAYADKNLAPLGGDYYTADDFDLLLDMLGSKESQYIEIYVQMMQDNFSNSELRDDVESMIMDIMGKNPSAISEIYESADDEKEISYVYFSPNSPYAGGKSRRAATAQEKNVAQYWADMWRQHIGKGVADHPQYAQMAERYDLQSPGMVRERAWAH